MRVREITAGQIYEGEDGNRREVLCVHPERSRVDHRCAWCLGHTYQQWTIKRFSEWAERLVKEGSCEPKK